MTECNITLCVFDKLQPFREHLGHTPIPKTRKHVLCLVFKALKSTKQAQSPRGFASTNKYARSYRYFGPKHIKFFKFAIADQKSLKLHKKKTCAVLEKVENVSKNGCNHD